MTVVDLHQATQYVVGVMLWVLAVALLYRSRMIARGMIDTPSPVMTALFGLFLATWALRQTYWNVRYLVEPQVSARMADAPWFPAICSIAAIVIGACILTIAARDMLGQRAPVIIVAGVVVIAAVGFIIARG